MAEQEVDRLWEELKRVEQEIKDQEAKIDDAIENNKPEKVTDSYRERKERLVDKEKDLRRQLSALQIRLATPSGEVLAAARCCLVKLTQDSQLLGVSRKLLDMSLVPKLCHPVLRAFVCSSPWCKYHGLLCSLCWASVGLLLGPAARKVKNVRALHPASVGIWPEHQHCCDPPVSAWLPPYLCLPWPLLSHSSIRTLVIWSAHNGFYRLQDQLSSPRIVLHWLCISQHSLQCATCMQGPTATAHNGVTWLEYAAPVISVCAAQAHPPLSL